MPFPVESVSPTLAPQVLDCLPDPIAVVDADGTIVAVNRAWEQFGQENGATAARSGVGVNYLTVCRHADGLHAAEGHAVGDGLAAVLAGDLPRFTLEYPCHAPHEERWFSVTVRPLQPPDAGAVVVHTAVTAQKQAAVLEQFLGDSLAHHLRNPLTRMQLAAQLLERQLAAGGVPERDRLAPIADGLTGATRQMTALLDGVQRGLALPALPAVTLDRRPTDLVTLVGERLSALRQRTPLPAIALDARIAQAHGSWDGARLGEALDHLLENALTYSPPESAVQVRVDRLSETTTPWVALEIADQGIGIPADDLPHVFVRFYRGRNAIAYAPGTGLGLTWARRLIGLHGGSVALASREGDGTTATVRLPLAA
jgi:signal transduction histidine kinase